MSLRICNEKSTELGLPLGIMKFGTPVRRPMSDTVYIVVSPMDGSGNRALVTLPGGSLKVVDQTITVIPLSATLTIHGVELC